MRFDKSRLHGHCSFFSVYRQNDFKDRRKPVGSKQRNCCRADTRKQWANEKQKKSDETNWLNRSGCREKWKRKTETKFGNIDWASGTQTVSIISKICFYIAATTMSVCVTFFFSSSMVPICHLLFSHFECVWNSQPNLCMGWYCFGFVCGGLQKHFLRCELDLRLLPLFIRQFIIP